MTLPAKLFRLVSETAKDARLPCDAIIDTGFVASVKSGAVDRPIPAASLRIVEA